MRNIILFLAALSQAGSILPAPTSDSVLVAAAARVNSELETVSAEVLSFLAENEQAKKAFIRLHKPIWNNAKKVPRGYLRAMKKVHARIIKNVPRAEKTLDRFAQVVRKKYGVNWKKMAAIAAGVVVAASAGMYGFHRYKKYKIAEESGIFVPGDRVRSAQIPKKKLIQMRRPVFRLRGKMAQEERLLRQHVVSPFSLGFGGKAAMRLVGMGALSVARYDEARGRTPLGGFSEHADSQRQARGDRYRNNLVMAMEDRGYRYLEVPSKGAYIFISPESDGDDRHVVKVPNPTNTYVNDERWRAQGVEEREGRTLRRQVRRAVSAARINAAGLDNVKAVPTVLVARPNADNLPVNDRTHVVVEQYIPQLADQKIDPVWGAHTFASRPAGLYDNHDFTSRLIEASHIAGTSDLQSTNMVWRGGTDSIDDGHMLLTDVESPTGLPAERDAIEVTLGGTEAMLGLDPQAQIMRGCWQRVVHATSAKSRFTALKNRKKVAKAWKDNRVVQEIARTLPGFAGGPDSLKDYQQQTQGLNDREWALLDKSFHQLTPAERALFARPGDTSVTGWHWATARAE